MGKYPAILALLSLVLAQPSLSSSTLSTTGTTPSHTQSEKDLWKSHSDQKSELNRDIVLFINTLFPDESEVKKLNLDDNTQKLEKERRDFLKRLFIILAEGPLKMSKEKVQTKQVMGTWGYPLATALGHGQRILIEAEGISGKSLLNLVLTGIMKVEPPATKPSEAFDFKAKVGDSNIATYRRFASHGLVFKNNIVEETKLDGLTGKLQNAAIGNAGRHIGVNITFGGLGHEDIDGNIIGPGGTTWEKSKPLPKRQHGHVYLQYLDYGNNRSTLMFGLESNEPLTENMFGVKHNAKSGTKVASEGISVTGGQKMQVFLGKEAPAEYGGMRVHLDSGQVKELESLFQNILAMDETKQKELFEKILKGTGPEAHATLPKLNG